MKPRIAVQVYSLRDEAERDFAKTMRDIKAMGFEGVELAGLYRIEPAEVGRIIRECGLEPVSAHVPLDDMRSDIDAVIADYKAVGVRHIAVPYLAPEDRPESGNFAKTVEDIVAIAKKVTEAGITLSYHNHDFEFAAIDGKYALDMLYESVPCELLSAELDTCWVRVAGEDPVKYIDKYASRMPLLHLKSYYGRKSGQVYGLIGLESRDEPEGDFEYRSIGGGVVDMKGVCEAGVRAGAEWMIVEQDSPTPGKTPLECIAESADWLKQNRYM